MAKKQIANKRLKCWMRVAKNGKPYRACAVPEKEKQPKREVRDNPRPEHKRKKPYLVAYGSAEERKKEQAKRRKETRVSTAKPKKKIVEKPVKSVNKAQEYKKRINKKVKDMTAEEKREYARLRKQVSREKAKPKPVEVKPKKKRFVVRQPALTSTDASGKKTKLYFKKGKEPKVKTTTATTENKLQKAKRLGKVRIIKK